MPASTAPTRPTPPRIAAPQPVAPREPAPGAPAAARPSDPRGGGGEGAAARAWVESGATIISRRYHFSPAGLAYVATTCVLIVGAVNGQNNLLFWLFGLAVAGLIVSGVLSGWSLMGIRVRREAPPSVTAGEDFEVVYHLSNRNYLFGAFGLVIEDRAAARTWLGKLVRADYEGRLGQPVAFAPYCGPRRVTRAVTHSRALARGAARLGPMRIASSFPFGLTRKSVTALQEQRVLVRPAFAVLADSPGAKPAERDGPLPARLPSRTGTEFFAIRPYQSGDTLRSVAWRATARSGRPMVRVVAEEPGERVWIVLDDRTQASGGLVPQAFELAVSTVATLARDAGGRGLSVIATCASARWTYSVRPGTQGLGVLLDHLATVSQQEQAGGPRVRPARGERVLLVQGAGAIPGWGGPRASAVRVDRADTFASGTDDSAGVGA